MLVTVHQTRWLSDCDTELPCATRPRAAMADFESDAGLVVMRPLRESVWWKDGKRVEVRASHRTSYATGWLRCKRGGTAVLAMRVPPRAAL